MKRLIYVLLGPLFGFASFGQGLEIIQTDTKSAYEDKSYLVLNSLKFAEGFSAKATTSANGEFYAKTANNGNERPFITTWDTEMQGGSVDALTIGITGDFLLNWIDLDDATNIGAPRRISTPLSRSIRIEFPNPGKFLISVSGEYNLRSVNGTDYLDRSKLLSVEQWGNHEWSSMVEMFHGCKNLSLNASDNPNLNSVTDMSKMFRTSSFNQNIGNWDVSNVSNMSDMFSFSDLSIETYDQIIEGWSQQHLQQGVELGAERLIYCESFDQHNVLTDNYNWDIIGDSFGCEMSIPFVTRWKSDNAYRDQDRIRIPVNQDANYRYYVNWFNVEDPSMNGSRGPFSSAATITFPEKGTYELSVSGIFPSINFGQDPLAGFGNGSKIISIEQWGDNKWRTMESAFSRCSNIILNAADSPNLEYVTDMSKMFMSTYLGVGNNQNVSNWDVGGITNMSGMFSYTGFNGELDSWDVSNVQNMENMFYDSRNFNHEIGSWDVSNVVDMSGMFSQARSFSKEKYDATLQGWATLTTNETRIPTGVSLGADGLKYCAGEPARTSLVSTYGWTITGDALSCSGARIANVVLSSETEDEYPELTIYPNPADTYLQIVDDNLIDAEVTIYDLNGRVIFQESEVANTQMSVDIYYLPSGTFIVKIEKEGKVSERKLIIQH